MTITTSFAATFDPFYDATAERRRAARMGRDFDRVRGDGPSKPGNSAADGQAGGMILDALFSLGFPGLGMMFNPLGATDVVEVYDTFRHETRRSLHDRRRNANPEMMAPPRPPRRRTSILEFIFG